MKIFSKTNCIQNSLLFQYDEEQNRRILYGGGTANGIFYDIASSRKFTNVQKQELINAVEGRIFKDLPLNKVHKNLLWRIRNEHHIRNSFLFYEAEPASILDQILW